MSFGDDSFCEFDPSTSDDSSKIKDYTYIKTGTNTGILIETTVLPPNKADLTEQNVTSLNFTSNSGGTANAGTTNAASFTVSTAKNYAPASLVGRTISFSGGGKATFGSDGMLTYTHKSGSTSSASYTYAQYSPVGAMLVVFNSYGDGSTSYIQLQFTSATSGSLYETDFDSTGAEEGLGSRTFTMQ